MTKKFDVMVVVGRFQPVHLAHVGLLKKAAELSDKVVVIIGSAGLPRTFKNPWVDRERGAMLIEAIAAINPEGSDKFAIEKVHDTIYDNPAWEVRVQRLVGKHSDDFSKIGIIGYQKDDSSFYLKKSFPQWTFVEQPLVNNEPLNATDIREVYFNPEICNLNWFTGVLPETTIAYLRWFKDSPEYNQVVREREFTKNYKKQFEHLKHPPTFVTVDAIVIQSGHVLLVKRKEEPGRDLWAFPGGFLDAIGDKSIEDAMIRELQQETKIKLQERILRRNIRQVHVFDAIERSSRGRTITHCFHIRLLDGEWDLPKVKGGDDAKEAKWWPISAVTSEMFFEDHYEILQYFMGEI